VAGEQFVARVAALPGEVLVFQHGFYTHLAGKASHLHSSPLGDALPQEPLSVEPGVATTAQRAAQVQQMWLNALSEQAFDWVIVDRDAHNWLPYYIPVERLFPADMQAFYPVTGARTRPEHLLVRNPVAYGGTLHLADPQADYLLADGWSVREEWGRWIAATDATLNVALVPDDYTITLEVFPFCFPTFTQQHMTIYWNEQPLGSTTFNQCETQHASFTLPAAYITGNSGEDLLRITVAQTTAPGTVGMGADNRQLGVGLVAVTFAPGR
jgi:hypothetical protein